VTRYLISFDDGAMTFPEEDLPAVAEAAYAVVREAEDAGVWVFGGGLTSKDDVSVVGTDGTVTEGPDGKAYIGGFSVVDVPSREEALEWRPRSPSRVAALKRSASSGPDRARSRRTSRTRRASGDTPPLRRRGRSAIPWD
jgi:hypothetical protein